MPCVHTPEQTLAMQTFLPYRSVSQTAAILDRQRLGKQRVEGLQILKVLTGQTHAWQHHPAVLMWAGYERALRQYVHIMCLEWMARGYQDSVWESVQRLTLPRGSRVNLPPYFTPSFSRSHQSNLVRKDPEHYRKYFPRVPDNLPYVWPVRSVRSKSR